MIAPAFAAIIAVSTAIAAVTATCITAAAAIACAAVSALFAAAGSGIEQLAAAAGEEAGIIGSRTAAGITIIAGVITIIIATITVAAVTAAAVVVSDRHAAYAKIIKCAIATISAII